MSFNLYDKVRASNGLRTRSLFVDVCRKNLLDESFCLYWLDVKTDPADPRPSIREHFLLSMDPTGYETAMKYFGSYEHWEVLLKTPWFKESHDKWQSELAAKIKSKAIRVIREIAENPEDKQALAASKYLATAEYNKVDNRGRPSKEEVTGKLKQAVEIAEADLDDMKRIGLKVVK